MTCGVSLVFAGCASISRAKASGGTADGRDGTRDQTIAELRAKNAGDARRIEELENRIFILEDRLDSGRLAAEQEGPTTLPARDSAARLPSAAAVGTAPERPAFGPAPGGAAPAAASPGAPDDGASSLLSEQEVEYAGEALPGSDATAVAGRSTAQHRPLLRLGAPEPWLGAHPLGAASSPEPLRLYRHALESLRAGHQSLALAEFRRFLDGNPRHDYADNAQYWIGECFYDLHDFGAAEPEFRKVIERYPRGNKVPDAMLKLGFTLLGEGEEAAGMGVLESLTRAFPKHEASRLAIARLAHPEAEVSVAGAAGAPPGASAGVKGGPTLGTIVPPAPGALGGSR